ncbi:alpha/beta hydrolase [Endothiovibrio diazotrophicus]
MRLGIYIGCLILSLSFTARSAYADEVTLPYGSLTLNGNLELAEGKTLADGVILITHGGLMYRGMELYVYLQRLFKGLGYSTLAINLSLGVDDRHGRYDCKATHRHRYTDAPGEIGAWVGWLKAEGARAVVLLGHSRGGAETALFAAEHDDPVIRSVVLLAPDTRETNDAAAYEKRYHKPLEPLLERARELIEEGRGDTVLQPIDFLYCADTSATADCFVSYYGADPRLDTAYLIPQITKPLLVLLAGDDEIVVNDQKFPPLAERENVEVKWVEGAGHFFRDLNADDAVEAIDAFLRKGQERNSLRPIDH